MAKVYGDETTALDEFKKLKGEPFKVKLQWLFQYYGLAFGITLGFIALAIVVIITVVNNTRPIIISGLCYTSEIAEDTDQKLTEYILSKGDFPKKKYVADYSYHDGIFDNTGNPLNIEAYYVTVQKTVARISAKDLDFLVAYDFMFTPYVSTDETEACAFEDLSTFLPADLYEKLSEEGRIAELSGEWGSRPCMILLDGTALYDLLGISGENQYIGFCVNRPHEEAVKILIDALK